MDLTQICLGDWRKLLTTEGIHRTKNKFCVFQNIQQALENTKRSNIMDNPLDLPVLSVYWLRVKHKKYEELHLSHPSAIPAQKTKVMLVVQLNPNQSQRVLTWHRQPYPPPPWSARGWTPQRSRLTARRRGWWWCPWAAPCPSTSWPSSSRTRWAQPRCRTQTWTASTSRRQSAQKRKSCKQNIQGHISRPRVRSISDHIEQSSGPINP